MNKDLYITRQNVTGPLFDPGIGLLFGPPYVKRFALCYRTVVLSVCPVCTVWHVRAPQFSAHICCDQLAGWIKTTLGTEVGRGPGHIVLDGDPAPLPKRRRSPLPNFRPISVEAKRLDASRCHLIWR